MGNCIKITCFSMAVLSFWMSVLAKPQYSSDFGVGGIFFTGIACCIPWSETTIESQRSGHENSMGSLDPQEESQGNGAVEDRGASDSREPSDVEYHPRSRNSFYHFIEKGCKFVQERLRQSPDPIPVLAGVSIEVQA